jgi:hypothetical protein
MMGTCCCLPDLPIRSSWDQISDIPTRSDSGTRTFLRAVDILDDRSAGLSLGPAREGLI